MLVKLASSHSTCAQLLGADLRLRQRSQERKGRIGKERQEKKDKKNKKDGSKKKGNGTKKKDIL